MILKKKVSAITAMMVLFGGVLCNSDSVATDDISFNFQDFAMQEISKMTTSSIGKSKMTNKSDKGSKMTNKNDKDSNKPNTNLKFDISNDINNNEDDWLDDDSFDELVEKFNMEDIESKQVAEAKKRKVKFEQFKNGICNTLLDKLQKIAFSPVSGQVSMQQKIFSKAAELFGTMKKNITPEKAKQYGKVFLKTSMWYDSTEKTDGAFYKKLVSQTFTQSTIENANNVLQAFFSTMQVENFNVKQYYDICVQSIHQCDQIINGENNKTIKTKDINSATPSNNLEETKVEKFVKKFQEKSYPKFFNMQNQQFSEKVVQSIAYCMVKFNLDWIKKQVKNCISHQEEEK